MSLCRPHTLGSAAATVPAEGLQAESALIHRHVVVLADSTAASMVGPRGHPPAASVPDTEDHCWPAVTGVSSIIADFIALIDLIVNILHVSKFV